MVIKLSSGVCTLGRAGNKPHRIQNYSLFILTTEHYIDIFMLKKIRWTDITRMMQHELMLCWLCAIYHSGRVHHTYECQACVPDEANSIAHTGHLNICVVGLDIKQPPSQGLYGIIYRLSYILHRKWPHLCYHTLDRAQYLKHFLIVLSGARGLPPTIFAPSSNKTCFGIAIFITVTRGVALNSNENPKLGSHIPFRATSHTRVKGPMTIAF